MVSIVQLMFWLGAVAMVTCQPCEKLSDCACGEECVDIDSNKKCLTPDSSSCECKPGCSVFDIFIAPADSANVYGNMCSCSEQGKPENGERGGGCTFAAWRGEPNTVSVLERNPKCSTESPSDDE